MEILVCFSGFQNDFHSCSHHIVGVGLSEDLYLSGYMNVTGIDISSVVIQQMSQRCADKGELECMLRVCIFALYASSNICLVMAMDATEMEFPDECLDFIIDKGVSGVSCPLLLCTDQLL